MNIFFDMDYTIVTVDGSLRPLTRETFQCLRDDGHALYIWSGMGVRAREVRALGLEPLVSGIFEKPIEKFAEGLARLGIPVQPDFVVDDHVEIVSAFGGILVRPYFWRNDDDREMERVLQVINAFSLNGHSQDKAFRAKGTLAVY